MKKLLILLLNVICLSAYSQTDLTLWYNTPARVWEEALPIGNGRLGAMIFGDKY